MRYDVKKYLFVGCHRALKVFFEKVQEAGLVHFIDTGRFRAKELPTDIQNITNAVKVLRGLPACCQKKPGSYRAAESISEKILELKCATEKLEEEKRMIRLEIARTEVFGQFSLDDINYLEREGNRKIRFFFAKKGRVDEKALPPELFRVATAHGLDYFVSIAKEPIQLEHMFEMRIERELTTLKRHYQEVQWEIQAKDEELKTFSQYNVFLYQALTRKYNDYNLVTTENFANEEMEG
ncbi:MAG: V-type ATP synthase subunit I, partial [Waddliaceae bacterium]